MSDGKRRRGAFVAAVRSPARTSPSPFVARARSAATTGGALLVLAVLGASVAAPARASAHAPPKVVVPGAEALGPYALEPLDLSRASPRPVVALFEARGSATAGVVTACVALAARGWVDEAEPVAFEKLAGIAAATVTRARGKPPAWHEAPSPGPAYPLRRTLVADAPDTTDATLVIGFVDEPDREALACFAVSYGGAPSARDARVEAPFVAPPPPGVALRSLVWSVHHPREVVAALVVGVALLAIAYVRARPRPRIARRIRSTRGT